MLHHRLRRTQTRSFKQRSGMQQPTAVQQRNKCPASRPRSPSNSKCGSCNSVASFRDYVWPPPATCGIITEASLLCCCRKDNSVLASKVAELESAAKKVNSRVRELEAERDKAASKVHVVEVQLGEARHALALAQQSAQHEAELLQQQHEEAAHAAQQELSATRQKLQEQLAVAQAAAAAGSEQAAAAAEEREATLTAALADAQAAVAALEAAAAENEQRHRRALARMQDHVRHLEAEKQVGCALHVLLALFVCEQLNC